VLSDEIIYSVLPLGYIFISVPIIRAVDKHVPGYDPGRIRGKGGRRIKLTTFWFGMPS